MSTGLVKYDKGYLLTLLIHLNEVHPDALGALKVWIECYQENKDGSVKETCPYTIMRMWAKDRLYRLGNKYPSSQELHQEMGGTRGEAVCNTLCKKLYQDTPGTMRCPCVQVREDGSIEASEEFDTLILELSKIIGPVFYLFHP